TIDQGKNWGSISSLDGGDVIVERGHVSNANRQNVIYETATDSDAPVTKYLDDIDSLTAFNQVGNIQTQLGVLDGLTNVYPNVSGNGLFSDRTYLREQLLAGDLSKAGNYLEYSGGQLTVSGNILVTGGNAETEQGAQEKVDAVEVGGRNLLLDSDVTYQNADYLMHTYDFSKVPDDGTTVTVSLKADIGGDRRRFNLYDNQGGSVGHIDDPEDKSNGVYSTTFEW